MDEGTLPSTAVVYRHATGAQLNASSSSLPHPSIRQLKF